MDSEAIKSVSVCHVPLYCQLYEFNIGKPKLTGQKVSTSRKPDNNMGWTHVWLHDQPPSDSRLNCAHQLLMSLPLTAGSSTVLIEDPRAGREPPEPWPQQKWANKDTATTWKIMVQSVHQRWWRQWWGIKQQGGSGLDLMFIESLLWNKLLVNTNLGRNILLFEMLSLLYMKPQALVCRELCWSSFTIFSSSGWVHVWCTPSEQHGDECFRLSVYISYFPFDTNFWIYVFCFHSVLLAVSFCCCSDPQGSLKFHFVLPEERGGEVWQQSVTHTHTHTQ